MAINRLLPHLTLIIIITLTACTSVDSNQAIERSGSVAGSATLTPFQPLLPADLEASLTPQIIPADEYQPTNPPQSTISPTDTSSPTSKPTLVTTESLSPPATGSLTIWIDPLLPEKFKENLQTPLELTIWEYPNADLSLVPGASDVLSSWVYALVAPFPSVPYGLSSEELIASWHGDSAGAFVGQPILVDQSTHYMFSALWGEPATGAVQIVSETELLDYAWENRPSWAIVPFENLDPRWKVLEVDSDSPVRNDFNQTTYPLTVPISITGNSQAMATVSSLYGAGAITPLAPPTNRDPDHLTVLAMTGVTALVRATAYTMERSGITYPGKDIRDWLRAADITHISNEVPFAKNCPYPNPVQQDMRFCSNPRYIELLQDVGTDIVELTGDHFADWGTDAMYLTLDMYTEQGWPYYGGGANLQEGRQAITIEHNGNRLALIGCNAKGGVFAQASPNNPGAVTCDWDWMSSEVKRLREEGYLPIVTFQHFEYYTYSAQKPQIQDSRRMAEAGAVIISGSQAHQPQALEFTGSALIHYGLGNLFFDQYEVSYATRQAFIDRHVFYEGRHISTELLLILFIDYARPRPMTLAEREELLNTIFSASGW